MAIWRQWIKSTCPNCTKRANVERPGAQHQPTAGHLARRTGRPCAELRDSDRRPARREAAWAAKRAIPSAWAAIPPKAAGRRGRPPHVSARTTSSFAGALARTRLPWSASGPPSSSAKPDGSVALLNDRAFKSRRIWIACLARRGRCARRVLGYVREYVEAARGTGIGVDLLWRLRSGKRFTSSSSDSRTA